MFKRIFVIVADSLGCGTAPRSAEFGDEGANTIAHIASHEGGINLPVMESLGYGNITDILGVKKVNNPKGYYGKMDESSNGKDTMTGHWEMMGILTENPFKTFTDNGFPKELIDELEGKTGHKVIGNYAASGTEILKELGEEHIKTGAMIVYTSADSDLQVAAHEDCIPISTLHSYCEKIRDLTIKQDCHIARIIARPFNGKSGNYKFINSARKDFAVKPPKKTILDSLLEYNYSVIGIGKINDIFDKVGINKTIKAADNNEAINKLRDILDKKFTGLCLINLSDFDSYGHKRDLEGYASCIEELDVNIPIILNKLDLDDLLIITADHGNDPTFTGNDHTRENVPVIIYSRNFKEPKRLEPFNTLADVGATIADNFDLDPTEIGESFLDKLS